MEPTNQESAPAANPDAGVAVPNEYDALVSAAKSASAEYAKSQPAKESTALGDQVPSAGVASPETETNAGEPAASEQPAEDSNILARLLKAKGREAAQKQRDEVESYAAKRRAEADADAERRLRDADERARHLEREAEARALRRIEEMTSGEEILARQANKSDPLYQLAKRFEADLKARDERAEAMAEEIKSLRAESQERDQGIVQARTSIAERNFLSKATEDAFPYARAYWDSDADILARAKAVLHDAKAEAEKRGEGDGFYCDDKDVLAFLETEAKDRLSRKRDLLSKLLSPVDGDPEPSKGGSGRQGQGPKSRTLSTSAASERRASPKPPSQMTEEEAEVAMRQAASSAFSSKG